MCGFSYVYFDTSKDTPLRFLPPVVFLNLGVGKSYGRRFVYTYTVSFAYKLERLHRIAAFDENKKNIAVILFQIPSASCRCSTFDRLILRNFTPSDAHLSHSSPYTYCGAIYLLVWLESFTVEIFAMNVYTKAPRDMTRCLLDDRRGDFYTFMKRTRRDVVPQVRK